MLKNGIYFEKSVCKCGGNVLNNNDKSFIQLQGNKVAVINQCLIDNETVSEDDVVCYGVWNVCETNLYC